MPPHLPSTLSVDTWCDKNGDGRQLYLVLPHYKTVYPHSRSQMVHPHGASFTSSKFNICLLCDCWFACDILSQLTRDILSQLTVIHDDIIKWKHFPRYWPFVWGIHRTPVNSPYKGQWRGALMFSLIYAWTNNWVNNQGNLRHHHAHYDVSVVMNAFHHLRLRWIFRFQHQKGWWFYSVHIECSHIYINIWNGVTAVLH